MHGHPIGRPYSIHILMSLWLWGFWAKGAINAAHLSLATRVKKRGSPNGCWGPHGCRCCSPACWIELLCRSRSWFLSATHPPLPPVLLFVFRPASPFWLLVPCFSSACCCHSCSLPACFTRFPPPAFSASPPRSALDYEIFSSFAAALLSCVTQKKVLHG